MKILGIEVGISQCPRFALAVVVTLVSYPLQWLYLIADAYVSWYERWEIDTFGW